MPYLIGVAGPSGAGKTFLSSTLATILEAPVVSLDSYYRELADLPLEQRAKVNFDEPAALDHELLIRQVARLAAGGTVEVPVYDFAHHTRSNCAVRVHAADFVILEGLFALYWDEVLRLLSTRVYIEVADQTCFDRRLSRDIRERGRSYESVCTQYAGTVRPMAARYIWPSKANADVVVSGTQAVSRSAEAVLAHIERTALGLKERMARARAALLDGEPASVVRTK